MSALQPALADYLSVRRSLGFTLRRDAKLLTQFLSFLDSRAAETVTVEHAVAWASQPGGGPGWLAFRMSVVRGFARYLHTIDPANEVPPHGLLAGRAHRPTPYLYSEADIGALVDAAGRLRYPLGVATYRTLVGLLATTGLRVGEALGLDDDDFDPDSGVLTVRGKFGKSRLVPLHPTATAALRGYQQRRRLLPPRPAISTPALFVSTAGTRLAYVNVSQTFVKLVARAGLRPRSGSCRPRPHGLRHSFAVATLLDWYADGGDVPARLPLLSTYLGHVDPKNTYWYLQAAPELLALAAGRLDTYLAGRP